MEDYMQQNIFTFIEYEPLWVSVAAELKEAARDFSADPKRFIIDLFHGDPLQAKRKRFMRVGLTCAMFVWVFFTLVYIGLIYSRSVQATTDVSQLQKIVDLAPLTAPEMIRVRKMEKNSGGGGGGNHESTPATVGRLARASLSDPIVRPTVHQKIETPSLPITPTVQVSPDLIPQQNFNIPLGDPNGVIGPPSDGVGDGGGIGSGCCGGVGRGNGTGVGPGKGWGIGGGSGGDGGDERIYPPGQGVKSPQILSKTKPKYTEEARRDKIQGVVTLTAIFRKDGTIADIRVTRGLGYGLDEEAMKAAALIKFIPGRKDGNSVNVRAKLEFTFSLL
jgi:periplasmic protein TonB